MSEMEIDLDLDTDPALATAVLEIEAHIAGGGWDQPGRLYALVDTAELVRREPDLAAAMGLDAASEAGSFTPVEQEQLPPGPLEEALEQITWPADVRGCAAVVERLVLPPGADAAVPEDPEAAAAFAREHPARRRSASSPASRVRGRRTVPSGCAPTTTSSRWWVARTWCPG